MGKFSQDKGKRGEREIAKRLNEVIEKVLEKLGRPLPEKPIIQRRQNQSAVGGSDLVNPLGISFEVKNHARLSLSEWWSETILSADQETGTPVLIYKIGRAQWKVRMLANIPLDKLSKHSVLSFGPTPVDMSLTQFLEWFALRFLHHLRCMDDHGM